MTWIIRKGEVLNPGGDGIRLENAPGDVEISQMMVNVDGTVGISISGAAATSAIDLDELIRLLREHLGEVPADDRTTAANLLEEVETNPPPKRVMSVLKTVYDMIKGAPGSFIAALLRDVIRDG